MRRLADQYQDLFGEELPPVAYAWAGSFAETRDGLPFIGRVPGMNPRLQFALCYGGNGITYSVHAGDMIRAGIEGRPRIATRIDVFGLSGRHAWLTHGASRRRRHRAANASLTSDSEMVLDDVSTTVELRRHAATCVALPGVIVS